MSKTRYEDDLFRRLVTELREPTREAVDPDVRPDQDSIDSQVDDLLTNYVHEAKVNKMEGRDPGRFVRGMRRVVEDTRTFAGAGDGERGTIDELDVEELVDMIARLVDNYENLLDIRGTLLRRAVNHVRRKFDDATVDSMVDTLRKRHGIDVDDPSNRDRDQSFQAPRAGEAGPMGT